MDPISLKTQSSTFNVLAVLMKLKTLDRAARSREISRANYSDSKEEYLKLFVVVSHVNVVIDEIDVSTLLFRDYPNIYTITHALWQRN